MSFSIAAPSTESAVLTSLLSDVKQHLRVPFSSDDAYIRLLLQTAIAKVQETCRRQLVNATVTLKLDSWLTVGGAILCPRPPLVSVTNIVYLDQDSVSITWSSTNYIFDTTSEPGRIALAEGESFPVLDSRIQTVTVTYVAGYGTEASDIPAPIVHAIFMLVRHWYEQRAPVVTGTIAAEIPKTVDYLLADWRFLDERILDFVR